MAKLTHYNRSKTTAIRNDMLQSRALSWKAKGLLACLLSFPSGWEYRRNHIVNECSADGEHVWRTAIKELILRGYVSRHRANERGRWEYSYLVSDAPMPLDVQERFHQTGRL